MTKRRTDAEIIAEHVRKMGSKGGKARAASLSKAELSAIGRKAALARWEKQDKARLAK